MSAPIFDWLGLSDEAREEAKWRRHLNECWNMFGFTKEHMIVITKSKWEDLTTNTRAREYLRKSNEVGFEPNIFDKNLQYMDYENLKRNNKENSGIYFDMETLTNEDLKDIPFAWRVDENGELKEKNRVYLKKDLIDKKIENAEKILQKIDEKVEEEKRQKKEMEKIEKREWKERRKEAQKKFFSFGLYKGKTKKEEVKEEWQR